MTRRRVEVYTVKMKKAIIKYFFLSMLLLTFMCPAPSARAEAFSANDLQGYWYFHGIVTGDSPNETPRRIWGTLDLDQEGSGSLSLGDVNGYLDLDVSFEIDPVGILTFPSSYNETSTRGVMSGDRHLIVFTTPTTGLNGFSLFVSIKRETGTSFAQEDITGTWNVHDAPV